MKSAKKSYEGPLLRRKRRRRVLVGAQILLPPHPIDTPKTLQIMIQSVQRGDKRTQLTQKVVTNASITSVRLHVMDRVVPPHKKRLTSLGVTGAAGSTLAAMLNSFYFKFLETSL